MTFTYSATSVVVPATIYNKSKVTPKKWMNRTVNEDGSVKTSDRTIVEWYIDLTFRCDNTKRAEVRNFFLNTVKYGVLPFTFTPDFAMDAGAGAGTAVTVFLWQDSLPEPYDVPGSFVFDMLLRAIATGGGAPS